MSDVEGQSVGSDLAAHAHEGEEEDEEEVEEEDEEEYEEEEEQVEVLGGDAGGIYTAMEVNDSVFEELHLSLGAAQEVQNTWTIFLRSAESREAAGEAIYAALFDSAPSLQSLFKTPRAVMAMRFMNGLNQIISLLSDPKGLKVVVETLGFQHLDLEVTIPRIVIFRDAIVDLLQVELGAQLSPMAHAGWQTMLNYVGGAYIYVRVKYAERLKILASSWAIANKSNSNAEVVDAGNEEAKERAKREEAAKKQGQLRKKKTRAGMGGFGDEAGTNLKDAREDNSFKNTSVPTTYNEMFAFNAAVMGFGQSTWMNEVLASFDTIVTNVSNSYRLQEECDVLSLRIAKYKGTVTLTEYKAVMLASLRSLVPKDWNSQHEVAWSWLWENVERMLKVLMGKPTLMERSLERLWSSLDEMALSTVRREVYSKFFQLAPSGQDFFKQSTTRLHFIADRIVSMTLEIYKDPKKMAEDISALGLRHVGYGIPTELFGPFVTACVQVVRSLTDDDGAEEAFRWSLSLISRILVRVITEGSTIVMKAINVNSAAQLRKAVGCAPRGKRTNWLLKIQVGTQSISPMLWAIETGSLEAAKAIIEDLLTIRADRDRYYYGMDDMFGRHEDIVRRLCLDAPALLPTLLDGLVWRSRTTENGTRRVNYYIKHLVVDSEGNFAQAVEWITDNGDPKLVCHPIVAIITDLVWGRIAFRAVLVNKSWELITLIIFVVGTGGLKHSGNRDSDVERYVVFICRCVVYVLRLAQLMFHHVTSSCRDVRRKELFHAGPIVVPAYLNSFQEAGSLVLTLLLLCMLITEPILQCVGNSDGDFEGAGLFTAACPQADNVCFTYSVFSSMATIAYFSLIVDLSVFSTRVSAFVLVCIRVLSEVMLFLLALSFVILAFSTASSALDQDNEDFEGIPLAALTLLRISLGMYSGSAFQRLHDDPVLLIAVVLYIITALIFLLNLLIAQLSCSYAAVYQDMLGYARLNRGKIVTEAMASVSEKRWQVFVDSLHLEERCEFGEGDIGLAGGVQVREPANLHVTTVDMIRRFGGSTSVNAQWPEDDQSGKMDEDRFEKIEKMVLKAMKRLGSSSKHRKGSGAGASSGLGSSSALGLTQSSSASDSGMSSFGSNKG